MRLQLFVCLVVSLGLPSIGEGQTTSWPGDPWHNTLPNDNGNPPLCSDSAPSLTPSSLGPARIGMSLRDLRQQCPRMLYSWLILEGDPQPVVVVRLGRVKALIELSDTLARSTVSRISTRSPAALLPEGVRPGTPVGDLARLLGPIKFVMGEGPLFAIPQRHNGYSLELLVPGERNWDVIMRVQETGDASLLPSGTRVSAILIVGPQHGMPSN